MTELTPEDVALLERARSAHDPSPADREAVRGVLTAKLGLAAMASGAPPPAPTAPVASVGSKMAAAKLVALTIVAAAAVGAAVLGPRMFASSAPAPAPTPAEPLEAPIPTASAEEPAAPEPTLEPTAAPTSSARAPTSTPRARTNASADVKEPEAPSTLAEETKLLASAQKALQAGGPSEALQLLDEHARRFPGGMLTDEQTAARVVALCALGRGAEARAIAQRFVAAKPRSPLARRLENACPSDPR